MIDIPHLHDVDGNPAFTFRGKTEVLGQGVSGNTIADLREVAAVWDKSADYCHTCGEPELASRDRRFAAAMREAASILEALRMDSTCSENAFAGLSGFFTTNHVK